MKVYAAEQNSRKVKVHSPNHECTNRPLRASCIPRHQNPEQDTAREMAVINRHSNISSQIPNLRQLALELRFSKAKKLRIHPTNFSVPKELLKSSILNLQWTEHPQATTNHRATFHTGRYTIYIAVVKDETHLSESDWLTWPSRLLGTSLSSYPKDSICPLNAFHFIGTHHNRDQNFQVITLQIL